jgi:hypothetical protein
LLAISFDRPLAVLGEPDSSSSETSETIFGAAPLSNRHEQLRRIRKIR